MNVLMRTMRGLIGLFIDDGNLALTVIGVLILVGLLTHLGSLDGSSGWRCLSLGPSAHYS
jgi:hypothetical protein